VRIFQRILFAVSTYVIDMFNESLRSRRRRIQDTSCHSRLHSTARLTTPALLSTFVRILVMLSNIRARFAFLAFLLGNAGSAYGLARQSLDIVYDNGVDRDPIALYLPDSAIDNTTTPAPEMPLVVLLHGRCMDGESTDRILRLKERVDEFGFALAVPEASRNRFWSSTALRTGGILSTRFGCRAWAATPSCCAAGRFALRPSEPETWEPVDDVAHISQTISAVKSAYNIANNKVYIVGWENGGFMAYRMACEKPDLVAGIVSISGLSFVDAPTNCAAFSNAGASPVNVLAIHGEFDNIPVDGGLFEGKPVPSVETTVFGWADHNGCEATTKIATPDAMVSRQKLLANAPDTDVVYFGNDTSCDAGGRTELRLVRGLNTELANAMTFSTQFTPEVLTWMFDNEGVSNNGFDDDDDDASAPAPNVETSSGPSEAYTFCPPDVLRCPDGQMVTRQVPSCNFQCADGAPSLAYLETICTPGDCCGTYGLCLSTSACSGASCPNDITLDNYDTYMNARSAEPPSSGAGASFAAASVSIAAIGAAALALM